MIKENTTDFCDFSGQQEKVCIPQNPTRFKTEQALEKTECHCLK